MERDGSRGQSATCATRERRRGYGCSAGIVLALLSLVPATAALAGSVAFQSIPFDRAVALSARIVKGTVKARASVKIDGGAFHYVEIAVGAVLKGAPGKPGELIRVFNEAEWFQHTHAEAIKAGVVSYADPHYATPLPDAEIKPGAALIVFLRGAAPPAGFPDNAAFLIAGGAFERPGRDADVARALRQKP